MIVEVSEAAQRLAELVEKVNDDRIAVHITSPSGTAVVVAEADFVAWQETAHLRQPPANASGLREVHHQSGWRTVE